MLKSLLNKSAKSFSARSGFLQNHFFQLYPYMYEPDQLQMLMQMIDETEAVPGAYVEIGCAFGHTLVFLHKYMSRKNIDRECFALDTFAGFVAEHAEHDIVHLGRQASLRHDFLKNKKQWLEVSLRIEDINDLRIIQCDAAKFDYRHLPAIAFCLLDIDLYLPTKEVLPKVYEKLAPGGVIVVDDCQPHPKWEGALVAYREFIEAEGLEPAIVCDKLGLIRKPPEVGAACGTDARRMRDAPGDH